MPAGRLAGNALGRAIICETAALTISVVRSRRRRLKPLKGCHVQNCRHQRARVPDKKHVGTIKRTRSVGCTTRRAQVADLTMVWLM
jgi:hypothetical protein